MDVGIVGYGAYVPMYRIKAEEIAKVWGADANSIKRGLAIEEKSVPGPDEDTATISVEAARHALKMAQIDPQDIGAIYIGSESHPYAVKPTATIVAEAIEATPNLTAADLEFACKAGTAGIQITSVIIPNGASLANFWYFDDITGNWTITVSDNSSAPDGNTGTDDATDQTTVTLIPVTATKFIILDPADDEAGDHWPEQE